MNKNKVAQSTRHILLIEPVDFFGNPETMETNVYQAHEEQDHAAIQKKALEEFRSFRNMLTENGVHLTILRGEKNRPDQIFPNWLSTHQGQGMILYPMYNQSRRDERSADMIEVLSKTYPIIHDFRDWENDGLIIESTGSMVMDHVNRKVYAGLSKRTTKEAVEKWCDIMGYKPIIFETESHLQGMPIYHTDLVIYIGTELAVVASEVLKKEDRDRVVASLEEDREVLHLTRDQQESFCGNSLEVLGEGNQRMLVMSSTAYNALTADQLAVMNKHFAKVLHSPLPTIEMYGGGSARCLMAELF